MTAAVVAAAVCLRSGPSVPAIVPPPASPLVTLAGTAMGCTWSVKLLHLPPNTSRDGLESAVAGVLDRLDGQMSTYRPDSDLSRFNRSRGGDWFPVPAELADVVGLAQAVSTETGGAFDVTVGPLVNLWGFGPPGSGGRAGDVPPDDAVAAARAHVGFRRLECRPSPPALRKADPVVYVDLGGIGKGYAADAVGANLDAAGAADALVTVGGEVRARGRSPGGRPWRVGIETPTPDVRRILVAIEPENLSVSTSGDYRTFFEADGRRYCHEIDPRTGRPIDAGRRPAAVTVVHPSGTYADAMATALMVLGPDDGYALADRLRLAALFVRRGDGRFETRATPAFERLVVSDGPATGPSAGP